MENELNKDELQDEETKEKEPEQNELVAQGKNTVFVNSGELTMWNDTKLMQNAWKIATVLSQTPIVPDAYKGNAGSCLIAIDIANRMSLSPIMIMQNSQVVKGNFTWKGSACKGLIDNCGRYIKTEYVFVGEENTPNYGCFLQAEDKQTGKIVKGTTITLQMAKDEGWSTKAGSKWLTMPTQMLMYRAATFFARTYCPQALMGFYTSDEIKDISKEEDADQVEKIKITLDDKGDK